MHTNFDNLMIEKHVKKNSALIGNFFFKLGKKSPKLHWEWGLISAPETHEKNPWSGSTSHMRVIGEARNANLLSRTSLVPVSVVFVGGEKRLYGVFIGFTKQIGGLTRSLCKME